MNQPRTSRAAFVGGVRAAVAKQPRTTPAEAPAPDEGLSRLVAPSDDIRTIFVSRARAAGITVHDESPLAAALTRDLRGRSVRRVTLAIGDDALREEVREILARCEIEFVGGGGAPEHFAADAGITDVIAAVAETGSIVVASGPHAPRGAALIPPLYIALVRWSRLVPDLLDLPPLRSDASARTIISGPSKTADIEGILITGVHGPKEVIVVLIP